MAVTAAESRKVTPERSIVKDALVSARGLGELLLELRRVAQIEFAANSEVTVPVPAMHPWSGRGARAVRRPPIACSVHRRGTSATGPNASDHGRAPAGFTPDIERSADGVEAIGHAL